MSVQTVLLIKIVTLQGLLLLHLYGYLQTLIFEVNLSFALGLILVKEPYFNEAGYDKQKETMEGNENSKKYNEMVLIKILQVKYELLPTW